jgi:hypothetical protein
VSLLVLLIVLFVGVRTEVQGPPQRETKVVLETNGGPRQVALRNYEYIPPRITYIRPGESVAITVSSSYHVRRSLVVRSWRCRRRVAQRLTLEAGRRWWRIPHLTENVYEVDVKAGRVRGILGLAVGEFARDDVPYVRC